MTAEQRIIKYLSGRKTPATQAEISRGAKVNPNTLRRTLGGLAWRRGGHRIWRNVDKRISLYRIEGDKTFEYSLA